MLYLNFFLWPEANQLSIRKYMANNQQSDLVKRMNSMHISMMEELILKQVVILK